MIEQDIVIKIKAPDIAELKGLRNQVMMKISQGATSGTEEGPDGSYTFTVTTT